MRHSIWYSAQGSILGPIHFILYVHDLDKVFSILEPMFSDDTNLFSSQRNVKEFFNTVNLEYVRHLHGLMEKNYH